MQLLANFSGFACPSILTLSKNTFPTTREGDRSHLPLQAKVGGVALAILALLGIAFKLGLLLPFAFGFLLGGTSVGLLRPTHSSSSSSHVVGSISSFLLQNLPSVPTLTELNTLEEENKSKTTNFDLRMQDPRFPTPFVSKGRNLVQRMHLEPFFSSRIWGQTLNPKTLVCFEGREGFYPANLIDFGDISYIQAESPQKILEGTKELYYQMVIESGANLLVAALSGVNMNVDSLDGNRVAQVDPCKYMDFLSLNETITMPDGTIISCIKEETRNIEGGSSVCLGTLKISKHGELDREIYQIMPNFEPLVDLCPHHQPFDAYREKIIPIIPCFSQPITQESLSIFNQAQQFIDLIDTITREHKIQINRAHPMIVNCIEGRNQSGVFIVLHTLYKDLFSRGEFALESLQIDLLSEIRTRASHLSSQSVKGAAIHSFERLFGALSPKLGDSESDKGDLGQTIQNEYIKSIKSLQSNRNE